jgi:metal-responsive CopG/Arc/MetJ family transcriptional regulator
MKVAISLPDPVFLAAERLARRLRVSRSQLYATALEEYVAEHDDARVTEQLDAVYEATQSTMDPALAAAQARALDDEAW